MLPFWACKTCIKHHVADIETLTRLSIFCTLLEVLVATTCKNIKTVFFLSYQISVILQKEIWFFSLQRQFEGGGEDINWEVDKL